VKDRNATIQDRDYYDSIREKMDPKWDGVGCYYCGSSDRRIDYGDGVRVPCPVCNGGGRIRLGKRKP
jgi:hypothetical protein